MTDVMNEISAGLHARRLIPYLGTGVSALAQNTVVPASPTELAAFLGRQVALPKRARGNPWAAAQYIESHRHRSTLTALMDRAYAEPVKPVELHEILAAYAPPMIIDTWYDGAMRAALETCLAAGEWGEIQGIPRAGIGEFQWYRAYGASGKEVPVENAAQWRTILYKPHGSVTPARNYLVADSDYVEILTEIDIQTPIPEMIRSRRSECGFLFLGCRFDDQMLRIYARQIMKRSAGPYYAVMEPEIMTRNEMAFLKQNNIRPVCISLQDVTDFIKESANK
ncbi:SIR2 family NAD-dependent protein deacylase [Komagataeibacter swingsii]|uniref:SIR2 family protein n=1 Tax=Komagataeibacter swingsii TaxID=215220 RepID=A0A2V4RJU0_9PROT|nr:SIR2 family protein [Komagataeibacter swingsii]PYD68965.1 SIR2 family protein [Komagataeibacter swingsii]GBQ63676.1 hypothetical protein AA16373_2719 [Komagataeibacter swingsii DSM 16373]